MREGDSILLRLRFKKGKPNCGYLGPYSATSREKHWTRGVEDTSGIWQRLVDCGTQGPRWLSKFPWCIFLEPDEDFIDDYRTLSDSFTVNACQPIQRPKSDEILKGLVQNDFLPESRACGYRTMRGVWVRSRAEYMIDNWFAEHGIVTFYEKAMYLDSVQIVPDWYIPSINIYVEFLGLKGDPKYDEKWSLKENAYRTHAITYITLVDEDLADLDKSIPNKLPQLKAKGILK